MDNMPISISLTMAQWNVVVNILAKGSYEQVAGIIGAMREQADAVIKSASAPAPVEETAPVQE